MVIPLIISLRLPPGQRPSDPGEHLPTGGTREFQALTAASALDQATTLVGPLRPPPAHRNQRNARVSTPHRDDALYQGTTLVGPHRPNKKRGFSPCVSCHA